MFRVVSPPSISHGNSLVLLPGWGADRRTWQALMPELQAHFDVFTVEYDESFSGDISVESLKTQFEAVLEALPDSACWMGWSLGGMLAVLSAEYFPERVSKVLCLATNLRFVANDSWPTAMPEPTFQQFFESYAANPVKTARRFASLEAQGDLAPKALMQRLSADFSLGAQERLAVGKALLQLLANIDLTDSLKAITQPVHFVFGAGDSLVPVAAAAGLDGLSQSVSVECIDACGHAPHYSHPQRVVEGLLRFAKGDDRYTKQKDAVARSFTRASTRYERYAHLQNEVAESLIRAIPALEGSVLDVGCGTGFCIEKLQLKSPSVRSYVGLDLAQGMLNQAREKQTIRQSEVQWVCADFEATGLGSESFEAAVSSLSIQWSDDLPTALAEIYRVLKPGACFAFSTLGPATLNELAFAWKQAEPDYVHVNHFDTADTLFGAAESAGFELEYFSREERRLKYSNVFDLMRELKGIGAHNVNAGKNPNLSKKTTLLAMEQAYESFRGEDDRLPATYEVYYLVLRK